MKTILSICLLIFATGFAGAQNIRVFDLDGKAVIKHGQRWDDAAAGDVIDTDGYLQVLSGSVVIVNENGRHSLVTEPGIYLYDTLNYFITNKAHGRIDEYFAEVWNDNDQMHGGQIDRTMPVSRNLSGSSCSAVNLYPMDSALIMNETINFTYNEGQPAYLLVYDGNTRVWKQQWGNGNTTVVRVPENFYKTDTYYSWAVCTNENARPDRGWNTFRVMTSEEKSKYQYGYNLMSEELKGYPADTKQRILNAFADGRQVVR